MKIMFVEPPKDFWFVMGEYLPPPLGILSLAAYLREHDSSLEIEVVDCNAERMTWRALEERIETSQPDLIAPSALATCNAFVAIRTIGMAKTINSEITTVVGGQHFSALAKETLETYPELDIVVRGEGEQTLLEVVKSLKGESSLAGIRGITFRHNGKIVMNPERSFFERLEDLPFPAYDLVEDYMEDYHFTMMAGRDTPFALVEASRGCPHNCNFCTQCVFWGGKWRPKSPQRIADEFEYCYNKFGTRFFWLTDDNFGLGKKTDELCDEIISKGFADDIMWFMQARCDDIVNHKSVIPKLRKAGLTWILAGVESHSPEILASFNKRIDPTVSKEGIRLLKHNDIFAQATLIIGDRSDSHDTIEGLRAYVNDMDPDIAITMILTPYPGTPLYEKADSEGWIEDRNWAHYDMIHAIMPTEHLSREEVQEELYLCYRSFYGSMKRRIAGVFSSNKFKRRTYRYMMRQGVMGALRRLF